MVVPQLPQEIVEEIIDNLTGDKKSLFSCSVVSTSWVDRCRHHLFADVKFHSLLELRLWLHAGFIRYGQHVRYLDLSQPPERAWITPDTLSITLDSFTSFRNVESLVFTNLDLSLFNESSLARFFGHMGRLTSLSIEVSTVIPGQLGFFVCMFPRLDDLKLDGLIARNKKSSFTKPSITPRFRGKLTLLNLTSDGTSIIAPFIDPQIPMAFKEVHVESCRFDTPRSLKDVFVACQEKVKVVKVSKIYLGELYFRGSPPRSS